MRTEFDFKSVLLLQLFYLLQNVRSKHHCSTCRHSDEDSQSQENNSDLDEIPVVSIESPIPISFSQVNPISMTLPQILIPQMPIPSMTMTAGSFPTSLFPGQRLVFFRIPSSYVNVIKAILPPNHQSATTKSPATTTTSTEPQLLSKTDPPIITMSTEATTTTTTTTPTTLKPKKDEEVLTHVPALRFKNESIELENVGDLNTSRTKTEKEEGILDSVLQNIMNEFSERLLNTSLTEENNKDFNGRRRMMTTSIRKTKPISIISQLRILPIPDNMAKALLSHLRTVKHIPTARKKRAAKLNLK
ncbi:unnamed protein product [Arctia plantaginis]|uniref:Uncharacterized protein n=1 Tax=Arctia plantaginis TaxID=874455 RepID=A0A8S0Z513_ARCPL|nr:unnamed protein product [Arctia plantaginis]